MELGKHSFTIKCEFCKEALVFKSDTAMYKHFVRDPPTKSGQKTCVNALKKKDPWSDWPEGIKYHKSSTVH